MSLLGMHKKVPIINQMRVQHNSYPKQRVKTLQQPQQIESNQSNIRHVLLDMIFEFRCVRPISSIYEFSLQRYENFGFASSVELRYVQSLNLLLVHQDDIYPFFELVNHIGLQIFVERHESLARSTPSWVHIDYHQFGVFLVEDGLEVVCVSDGGGQLYLFGRHLLLQVIVSNQMLKLLNLKGPIYFVVSFLLRVFKLQKNVSNQNTNLFFIQSFQLGHNISCDSKISLKQTFRFKHISANSKHCVNQKINMLTSNPLSETLIHLLFISTFKLQKQSIPLTLKESQIMREKTWNKKGQSPILNWIDVSKVRESVASSGKKLTIESLPLGKPVGDISITSILQILIEAELTLMLELNQILLISIDLYLIQSNIKTKNMEKTHFQGKKSIFYHAFRYFRLFLIQMAQFSCLLIQRLNLNFELKRIFLQLLMRQ